MANKVQITLPNLGWEPRPDQMPLWHYLDRGGLRADVVAHRRWGKDDVSLHRTAVASQERVGTYWHMLPEASQARKAIWDAVNPRTGKKRIDEAFPKEIRASTREQDMMIKFKNGSTWQVLGSDNYDSLVGSPPIGVVFSEWALARPDAWAYIRPILLENGGWAIFIWTPRGRNHATRAFEAREKDSEWFTQRMPATLTSVFSPEQLAKEKQDIIDECGSYAEGEAKFNSEYMVDFDSAVPGSYYNEQMQTLQTAGRIGHFPHDPNQLVDTAWDLGIDDYTSIWFFQRFANHINVIDYYETSDSGLDTIVKEALKNERSRDYTYGMHYLPHDVMVREIGASGQTRKSTLHKLGLVKIRVGVARNPDERINAVRRVLPYCRFHDERTKVGSDHLKQYRKKWNQSMGVFTGPLHNEDSHAADAFGEMAVNAKIRGMPVEKEKPVVEDRWARLRKKKVSSWKVL